MVTRLVTGPFRALGHVFRDEGKVTAVEIRSAEFEPGSAVVTPDAARHLQRVADFLRASPYVDLELTPVVTERDLEVLKAPEVTARVQRVQRDQGLASFAEATAQLFPRSIPMRRHPTHRKRSSSSWRSASRMPDQAARQLAAGRVTATRAHLIEAAGLEPERLISRLESLSLAVAGTPRVEFELLPAN